jgi:hypothetical protein
MLVLTCCVRISGGTHVLKPAAESREATLGYGARLTSTNMSTSSRLKAQGVKHDTSDEEECRDGRSGEVWRRRCSRSTAARKQSTEGLSNVRTPAAFWIRQWRTSPTLPLPTIARHT